MKRAYRVAPRAIAENNNSMYLSARSESPESNKIPALFLPRSKQQELASFSSPGLFIVIIVIMAECRYFEARASPVRHHDSVSLHGAIGFARRRDSRTLRSFGSRSCRFSGKCWPRALQRDDALFTTAGL